MRECNGRSDEGQKLKAERNRSELFVDGSGVGLYHWPYLKY
jgi:hypothetical protein